MAEFQWVILCERVIIEEQARTVSIVSILENLNLPQPPPGLLEQDPRPMVPFRFYVVTQWSRSKPDLGERVPGRIILVGPDRMEFGQNEFVVDLTGSSRARVISQTIGFPLRGAGMYTCLVQAKNRTKWRKVGQVEFSVSFIGGSKQRRH